MTKYKHVLSVGLAAAAFAFVLTYVLGAPTLLRTQQAETGHNLFMSLIQGITGGHSSMSRMHGGPTSGSQMQGMNQGILGNNILGSPKGMPAAGLAFVVLAGVIPLAVAAFVMSWKQKSFIVAGLLAASGIVLMIPPLANMNFAIPGPIIGVVIGLAILGLGVANSIRTAKTTVVTTRKRYVMINSKLLLEVALAAVVLFLATNAIGVHRQLASLVGIIAMGMSVVVFVMSLGQRSYVAAGLLVAAGVIYIIRGWIALAAFGTITFPSPITGVIVGLVILGLGVTKGIGTAMTVTVAPKSTIIAAAVTGAIIVYLVAGHTISAPAH